MCLTSVDKGTSWGKGLKYETGTGNVPYGTPIYEKCTVYDRTGDPV